MKYYEIMVLAVIVALSPALIYAQVPSKDNATQTLDSAKNLITDMESSGLSVESIKSIVEGAQTQLEDSERTGNYDDVIETAQKAIQRAQRGMNIADSIRATEIRISDAGSLDVSASITTLESAKIVFANERYDQAELLVEKSNEDLEKVLFDSIAGDITYPSIFLRNSQEFLNSNIYIISLVSVVFIISIFAIRSSRKKSHLLGLQREENVIRDMIKKTQKERFGDGVISKLVYNIRIQEYNKMLNKIRKDLMVLKGTDIA